MKFKSLKQTVTAGLLVMTVLVSGCGRSSSSIVGVWNAQIGAPDMWLITLRKNGTGTMHVVHTIYSGIPKKEIQDESFTWVLKSDALEIISKGDTRPFRILARSDQQLILETPDDHTAVTFKRAE